MAGHSQFKNIMHRKGRVDAVRSKLFSKLAREITVAAKMGLPDPDMNPRLRAAILAARAENMPKDNIQRAINKAVGGDGENYDEIRYEGYGPGGAAIIVEAHDRQPQPHRLRHPLLLHQERRQPRRDRRRRRSCSTGSASSSSAPRSADADTMLEAAIEAGADDVVVRPRTATRSTATRAPSTRSPRRWRTRSASRKASKLVWKPQTPVPVDDEAGEKLMRLMETLEEHDDVQNVYGNFELSDALMQKMAELTPSGPGHEDAAGKAAVRHMEPSASSASIPACATPAGASSPSRARSSPTSPAGS